MSDLAPPAPVRRPPVHSARRINALARRLGARRYLEIGVSTGQTFREVEIAERTGVDPKFRFDTAEVANATTHLHAMRSDAWFAEAGARLFHDHGNTHIDPPATAIWPATTVVLGLAALLS